MSDDRLPLSASMVLTVQAGARLASLRLVVDRLGARWGGTARPLPDGPAVPLTDGQAEALAALALSAFAAPSRPEPAADRSPQPLAD